ncbi:MAG TPA: leucyl aminopeptidase [Sulfuricurvum sp.]|nr:MAG: leucyl aminopeptidase [Campylobacterales bacterium 16-40-21]OZA04088.1 MAG: leucyl aminopeptidase [Sulfuricurvum sp. 17-40-25]HQS66093.1 leucyl aminopeptidase [Sulfuricurvum sp.]HQT35863.1 leucyl aminopeptidase [Sulfuricurvum sp.]
MNVKIDNQPLTLINADLTIEFITPALLESHELNALLTQAGFKADQEQLCALHEHRRLLCGVSEFTNEYLRSAMSTAVKAVMNYTYSSVKLSPNAQDHFKALIEGVILGSYQFNSYKSTSKELTLKEVIFSIDDLEGVSLNIDKLTSILEESLIVAKATNFVRDLVNQTPYDMTPQGMAVTAESLADSNDLECTILDVNGLEHEKMHAMLSVGRASINPPRLIHLSYKPANPKKVITLVGKGLTYDSGGLSLKAATSMVTMKMDKAGGCAVMGIIKAVSELKLDIEVHAFVGAVENMIGGNAYKPDDVLRAKNGKTIEVRNTDAEGRLVLADILGYAQENIKADYIFDYATLTGACMVALGPYTTGVMGHNEELKQSWLTASQNAGEYSGILPFNRHLKKLIKSDLADVSNVSSKPYGGAITAALFLDNFIDEDMKEKWIHFDIAGSAYTESPWDVNGYGGTGAGVRMTLEWLLKLQQQGHN